MSEDCTRIVDSVVCCNVTAGRPGRIDAMEALLCSPYEGPLADQLNALECRLKRGRRFRVVVEELPEWEAKMSATVWEYRRDGDYFSVGPFEGKDNGEGPEDAYRLAAAAPELLAAALEARRVLAAVQGMVIINRDPGTQRCLERLDDAIRKARAPLPEGAE